MNKNDSLDLELLARAALSAFGKNFDLSVDNDVASLRDLARKLADAPDSAETQKILHEMAKHEDLRLHAIIITPNVGAMAVTDRKIPENKRTLKETIEMKTHNSNKNDLGF